MMKIASVISLLFVFCHFAWAKNELKNTPQIYNSSDTLIIDGGVFLPDNEEIPAVFNVFDGQVDAVSIDTAGAVAVECGSLCSALDKFIAEGGTFIKKETVCARNRRYTETFVAPYIKVNGQWLIAQKFSVSTSDFSMRGANKSATVRANGSVLAEGRWVKVRVNTSGMKQLMQTALAGMGFNDISKISVYGNGGKQLPLPNSSNRIDDLAKLPVYRGNDRILFYAEGVETWSYSASYDDFECTPHPSDNYSYYYITDSRSPSESPATADYTDMDVTLSTNEYDSRSHHELRTTNLLSSGREWWGESLSPTTNTTTRTITLDLPERADDDDVVNVNMRFCGRSSADISYRIGMGDETIGSGTLSAVSISSTTGDYASVTTRRLSVVPQGDINTVKLAMDFSGNASDGGWIDYITLTSTAILEMSDRNELMFRNKQTFGASGATQYSINGTTAATVVWDITDAIAPVALATSYNNGATQVAHANANSSELIAFDPTATFEEPTYVGTVENQNLHALEPVDYIIVGHEDFLSQAERLAQLHRTHSGLTVAVVKCNDIYNEFSSGKRDVAAIRDFLKMMYDRSLATGNVLKYALLFGDGSFDNMAESAGNKIPTYQSAQSMSQSQTYATDDFFGWLDDNEGGSDLSSRMDIGIGRFPVQTTADADNAVDKTELYLTKLQPGAWKKRIAVIGDDGDSNEHIGYAENIANLIENKYYDIDLKKIYIDAYQPVTSSTGTTQPGAKTDFNSSINSGSLIVNFVGHGGPSGLGGIFVQKDIQTWTNKYCPFFFIGATCEFAPFDHAAQSAGEEALLYSQGGAIGVFAATRLVYGNSNYRINYAIYNKLLETDENGRRYTIGEAARQAKETTGSLVNSLKYVLLADPAIVLAKIEDFSVQTDSINGVDINDSVEPMPALATNVIKGSIRTKEGNVAEDFNGTVSISLYDKRNVRNTFGTASAVFTFEDYNTIVYNGQVAVENGRFDASFVLPKDINLDENYGKISYYAATPDSVEAVGATYNIAIGGIAMPAEVDTVGPTINAWIDYKEFANGSTTGSTPVLYAEISDPSGINLSDTGIGHNLSLTIDNDRENSENLNGFFTFDQGEYTSGTLVYQLSLDDGNHTLAIKAWDNLNNSSTVNIDIRAASDSKISFGKTKLYPNPLRNSTEQLKLHFTHNSGGTTLELKIDLYTISGQLLATKTITTIATLTQTDEINLSNEIPAINTLSAGLYVMKVSVSGNNRSGNFTKKFSVKAQ